MSSLLLQDAALRGVLSGYHTPWLDWVMWTLSAIGGAGAISVGSNARITSTFIFASNGSVRNLKAPWGVIGGDADTRAMARRCAGALLIAALSGFGRI